MDYVERFKQKKEQKKWKSKAEKYINNEDQAKGLLADVVKKAENKKSGPLKEVYGGLQLLIAMFKDYVNGSYKKIPTKALVLVVVGLVYFVSPIDIVPDFIVSLGFIDDASVLAFIIHQISNDIKDYKNWKTEHQNTENSSDQ